jgi:hypothetical protein
MRGSCSRLLAILLVISFTILLVPPSARSQSDRLNRTPDNPPTNPAFPIPSPITYSPNLIRPAPSHVLLPVSPVPIGFPLLAHTAGTIFSGTVTAVVHRPAHGQAIETVAITFRVEQAIRGATPGENLTIRQWMGVWSGGQRYRVGERVLLFLYPPSKLGLTSSVGGALGHFAVDPVGRVLLTAQHLAAFQKDAVLGGKSRLSVSDLAVAVRRASEEKVSEEQLGKEEVQ